MNTHHFHLGWLLAVLVAWTPARATAADYERDVKPLLRSRCYSCHGALKQEAGLRLDSGALIRRGGESGSAIEAGRPDTSRLVQRVSATDESERMPPEGEPLTAAQVDLLRAWIRDGAKSPDSEQPEADPRDHWAFRPVVRPPVPQVRRGEWVKNPIDAFVAQQHEQRGLQPQPEASRLLLLRRLSLDLIGLPPSPEEIAALQVDDSADWYERTVQRLLKDPRHGERWARHWMDVWRYSDWWGLGEQLRNSQKHIWHWRDWIVESLNDDVPYDQMVRLMLAADELAPQDLQQLRATGFLARNYFLFNRHQWMDEVVEHVGKGFLGLTANCAKCHAHKYDPLSQTDFYRLRAFFEPYHVRLDVVPGESDLSRDGIPRAFDGRLDAPTYLLIRGQETNPDKSAVIEPAIPASLSFGPLRIEPVELPAEAWQPERRAWVAEAYRQSASKKVVAAEAKLGPAREKIAQAERQLTVLSNLPKPAPTEPAAQPADKNSVDKPAEKLLVENFATLDPQRWKLFGGDWSHQPGNLEQKKDGQKPAALRWLGKAPRDFDASVKLTYRGGSLYRSVGVAFDCSHADPTAASGPDDSVQNVYVSAQSVGSKVQAAWQRGGKWNYPADAAQGRPVELNREHTLRVQVRDTLINASLNGEPAVAWRTPLARRDGHLQITTFDALVVLHEVTLAPLAPDVVLREPGSAPATPVARKVVTREDAERAVADARLELQAAEMTLAAAKAEVHSVEQRAAAVQAAVDPEKKLARAAVRAEREMVVAQTRATLADAELRLHRAPADKRDAITKEIAKLRESLEKALKQVEEPGEQFTRFVGAQWTPTRFASSGADDPAVTFAARSTGRRKALAEWITDRRNPLTARVAVNHVWMRHFGTPLVPTVFDFGRKGLPPTHPELLDWLASELMDNGWSLRHLHRLMVESATYRLSSSSSGADDNLAKDADNVRLWRRTPSRLESQVVRDSLLALAGTLDLTRGGPSIPQAQQAASTRRSLYFFHSNNERNLFLTTFDEALVTECYRREQSIVPQQALALTNSQLVLDASRKIAERIVYRPAEGAGSISIDESFVRAAFVTLLASEPTAAELAAAARSLAAWRKLPEAGQADAAAQFARANLVWVLLNHHDFITVR